MDEKQYLAIDIGGTNVKAAIVTKEGKILKFAEVPTQATESSKIVVGNILKAAEQVLETKAKDAKDKVAGIGVGCPGPLDLKKGTLHNKHRFPQMDGFNIKKAIEKGLGMNVGLDNDANCFILGEYIYGAAQGKKNVLGLTLGTGLGCGLIINKKLYHGATGMAAEIGISPYKGKMLEDWVTGEGLLAAYQQVGGGKYNSPKEIGMCAAEDKPCKEAFKIYGTELAKGIVPFVDLLDPELIVFGGSISYGFEKFIDSFEKELRSSIHYLPAKHMKIKKSALNNRAGLLGAAVLGMPEAGGYWG